VTKQLFAAALCRGLGGRQFCFPQFRLTTIHRPVQELPEAAILILILEKQDQKIAASFLSTAPTGV
jgi:hypothetical protein